MNLSLSRAASALGCLSILLLCGCTKKWEDAGTTHVSYDTAIAILVLLGSIAAIPIGWVIKESSGRFGYGLLIGGAGCLLLFAPGMFLDHATVNAEGFTVRTGIWFAPTRHDVKFDDVSSMSITSKTTRGRRGRKSTTYYLECSMKSGPMIPVAIGTLLEEGFEEILRGAAAHNIPIQDMVGAGGGDN